MTFFRFWGPFWAKFRLKYFNEYLSYESTQGMKSVLKVFKNFQKKRAWNTYNTPKTRNEIFEKLKFSKFHLRVLGVFWVSQALFLKIFENFETFKTLFISLVFSYDKYSLRYLGLNFAQNSLGGGQKFSELGSHTKKTP